MGTSVTKIQNREFPLHNLELSITLSKEHPKIDKLGYSKTDVSLKKYFEVEELPKLYYFDAQQLYPYLLENFSLVSFLHRAHKELSRIFPESIFILEVRSDSEIENWETLFVLIVNNLHDAFFENKAQDFVLNWMFRENPVIRKQVTIKEIC